MHSIVVETLTLTEIHLPAFFHDFILHPLVHYFQITGVLAGFGPIKVCGLLRVYIIWK
jgi:hypothetical protein